MQMPEIAVILTGNVFRVSPTTDFKTGQPNGAKIAVIAAQGDGATEVKLNQAQLDALRPVPGDSIAYVVEPFPWKMENGNAGVSFLYRATATIEHVSDLHDLVAALEPAGK